MSFNLLVEFSLHFTSFRNIDLLQQGIYHIKTQLSLHPRSSLFLPVVTPPSGNFRASSHNGAPDTSSSRPLPSHTSSSLPRGEAGTAATNSAASVAPSAVRATKSDGDDAGPGGPSSGHRGYHSSSTSGGTDGKYGGVCLRRLLRGHANCSLAAVPYTHFSSPLQLFEGDANREKYGFSGPAVDGEYKDHPPWVNHLRSAEQQLHWAYFSNRNPEDTTWVSKALSQSAGGPGVVLLNQQLQGGQAGGDRDPSSFTGGRTGGIYPSRGTARHSRRGAGGGGENRNSHALIPSCIDDVNYTFSTKGFLIRYCDEHVSISETVCFRVEIPCSSPSSLENLFAVLFLGLYFAPHLNHPAASSHQSNNGSNRASSSPYRSAEGGASKREASSPQEGHDERSRRNSKRSSGSSTRSYSKGSCKRGTSVSKNVSETLGDSTRLHTDSGVGTSNPQGTSDTGEGSAQKRGGGGAGEEKGSDSSGKRADAQNGSGGATCIAVKLLLISKFFKGLQTFVPVVFDEGQFALLHVILMASIVDIRLRYRPALPLTPFPFPVPAYTRKQVDNTLIQHKRLLLQSIRHTAKLLGQRGYATGPSHGVSFPDTSSSDTGNGLDTFVGETAPSGAEQLPGSRPSDLDKSATLGEASSNHVSDSIGNDGFLGIEGDFIDECWSDEDEDTAEEKGGTNRARNRGDVNDGGGKGVAAQQPLHEFGQQLLTLQPNLQAFLIGAGRAFAQPGNGRICRPGNDASSKVSGSAGGNASMPQKEGFSDDATTEMTVAIVTAAAAAAGSARRWFRSSAMQDGRGEGLRRCNSEVCSGAVECRGMNSRGPEALSFQTEDLLSGAAALHAAYLQLLIEVYIRLATSAKKLLTRCLPAEKCSQLLPLQRIDDLVVPGGGVLQAMGFYFRSPRSLPDGNSVKTLTEPKPAAVGMTGSEENLTMRLRVRRRSASEGIGQGQQVRTSTVYSVSANSSITQGEEDSAEAWDCGGPSGSSKEGHSFEEGKRTAASLSGRNLKVPQPRLKTPSGDVCSDGEVDGGEKAEEQESSVEVKIMRLEPRAADLTAKELANIITSDIHVVSRQLLTLWSRLTACVPVIGREVETLLRVNWEQQYTARLSPFILTQTVALRPSDPLYFPPPAAIPEQSLTAAATAASSVLSPRAARAAATALAAAALARRDHVYSQKCLDTAQALQDTALVATGHVNDEFILDSADDWRVIVGEADQRPMDVHDCRLLVACASHPVVFEQRYRVCPPSPHPPSVPPYLPLPPPSSSLGLACAPRSTKGVHLFVLVHGFQGCSHDMRLLRNNISVFFPAATFLCSSANQDHTEGDIEMMGKRLADEVHSHIQDSFPLESLARLSFIGHSLGGVIIRAALPHLLSTYGSRFFLYLSLSSPHFGFVKSKSRLVSFGVWLLKKWRKSVCLQQLTLSDAKNYSSAFLYRLSQWPGLSEFQHICLVASSQDTYAPLQSAAILLHRPTPTSGGNAPLVSDSPAARSGSAAGSSAVSGAPQASPRTGPRDVTQVSSVYPNNTTRTQDSGRLGGYSTSMDGSSAQVYGVTGSEEGSVQWKLSAGRSEGSPGTGASLYPQENEEGGPANSSTGSGAKTVGQVATGDDDLQPMRQSRVVELMGRNLLSKVNPEKVIRLNVNFKISEKNFDSFIGRAAHILFLENQIFLRMLLTSHPYLFQ
ncbi:serine esterase protein [Cystoisospora suis]|uniref:Serine esterase protein n=1 Tax=Cystoisospora suis TaxID=483139 RepID=A0A2C6L4A2_9APIC|nr:serine esterase protein [Cystoisospora suis]